MDHQRKLLITIGGGIIGFIITFSIFTQQPLPNLNGVIPELDTLKSLIQWGLNRQLTHASLTLAALVGLFSMLRMRQELLQKNSTRIAFVGFQIFLIYEYTKLIRGFQIVALWESQLVVDPKVENLFKADIFQNIFLSNNTFSLFAQCLLMASVVCVLINIFLQSFENKLKNQIENISEKNSISIPPIEWCIWQSWDADIINIQKNERGVYEVKRKSDENIRLTIGKSKDLRDRIINGLIKGKKSHSTGKRIREKEDITNLQIRWAKTQYPAAVEEFLIMSYMESNNGNLPEHGVLAP